MSEVRNAEFGVRNHKTAAPGRRPPHGVRFYSAFRIPHSAMVRLAHFSDIHLTARPLGWSAGDLVGKRTTGWVNLTLLGRGGRFRHAPAVVDVLRRDLATRGFDHLVFSGDATMMGFDSEMTLAAAALGVGDESLPPGIA